MIKRRRLTVSLSCLLATPARAADLTTALKDYERQSGGHVGVYAANIATGAAFGWRANERFVMCSTFKASLAACVLQRVTRGHDCLTDMIQFGQADIGDLYAPVAQQNLHKGALSVGAMCQAAVEQSDGACTNLLLARIGGPPALNHFWRSIGDDVSRLDHNEPMLNRTPPGATQDTTTPAAMAVTLRKLALGDTLPNAPRALFTSWLIGCQTGANRLRAGLPATWRIGDKTGHNGRDAAGDIAVAWPVSGGPIVMAAYTRGGAPADAAFDMVFKQIGAGIAFALA